VRTQKLSKEENERFIRVGRGTPGAELLRRYWWPVAFVDQVKGSKPSRPSSSAKNSFFFAMGRRHEIAR
jgi:hypothetical protein